MIIGCAGGFLVGGGGGDEDVLAGRRGLPGPPANQAESRSTSEGRKAIQLTTTS